MNLNTWSGGYTRIARQVNADVIVVEAHDHKRRFQAPHRSLYGRLVRTAPRSVLAVRKRSAQAPAEVQTAPAV